MTNKITRPQIEAIYDKRMAAWKKTFMKNECTPAAVIGVGHNNKSGEIHIMMPKDVPNEMMGGILRAAADEMDPKGAILYLKFKGGKNNG